MSSSLGGFYRGKRALITGHTGFQGGWAVAWLKLLGAHVCGYALPPQTRPNFFDSTILDRGMTSIFGDIRDRNTLASTFAEFQPEIVIHCAVQSSPQLASQGPVEAFSTNVMGTVHVLEEARLTHAVRSVVMVRRGSVQSQRNSQLDLITATEASAGLASLAFNNIFFGKRNVAVATVHSPEVIGGGDWREGRLVPTIVQTLTAHEAFKGGFPDRMEICHVLEVVHTSLRMAKLLFEAGKQHSAVSPCEPHGKFSISAAEFSKRFAESWHDRAGSLIAGSKPAGQTRLRRAGGQKLAHRSSNALSAQQAIDWTAEWYRAFCADPSSAMRTTEDQIRRYTELTNLERTRQTE